MHWINAGELTLGATVRNVAGEVGVVEARVVVDAPQVMHNLTIEHVATYVVGSGQWVVHNQPYTDAQIWGRVRAIMQSGNPSIDHLVSDRDQAGRVFYEYFYSTQNPAAPNSAYRNKQVFALMR